MPLLKDIIGESFKQGFYPKAKDEQRFWDKHVVELFKNIYSEAEYDKLFKASNIKTVGRKSERHGYETGDDAKVYEAFVISDPLLREERKELAAGDKRIEEELFDIQLHRAITLQESDAGKVNLSDNPPWWIAADFDVNSPLRETELFETPEPAFELLGESHAFQSLAKGADRWKKNNKSDHKLGHIMASLVDSAKECGIDVGEVQDWLKAHPWSSKGDLEGEDYGHDPEKDVVGGQGFGAGKKRGQVRKEVQKKFDKHLKKHAKKDTRFGLDSHESFDEDLSYRIGELDQVLAEQLTDILVEYHETEEENPRPSGMGMLCHAKDHVMGIAHAAKQHGLAIGATTAFLHGSAALAASGHDLGSQAIAHAATAVGHGAGVLATGFHHDIAASYHEGVRKSREARLERQEARRKADRNKSRVQHAKQVLKKIKESFEDDLDFLGVGLFGEEAYEQLVGEGVRKVPADQGDTSKAAKRMGLKEPKSGAKPAPKFYDNYDDKIRSQRPWLNTKRRRGVKS